jgi:hypothetical protein
VQCVRGQSQQADESAWGHSFYSEEFIGGQNTVARCRPTPNPNVLIEYGWALKSLTYNSIVPLMNTFYGEPKPEDLLGTCTYFILPFALFVVQMIACGLSFYAHVFFDKEYHVEESRLQRFAWFRRKQELHFIHHRHADSNFAVIDLFWDRLLGTYREPNA